MAGSKHSQRRRSGERGASQPGAEKRGKRGKPIGVHQRSSLAYQIGSSGNGAGDQRRRVVSLDEAKVARARTNLG